MEVTIKGVSSLAAPSVITEMDVGYIFPFGDLYWVAVMSKAQTEREGYSSSRQYIKVRYASTLHKWIKERRPFTTEKQRVFIETEEASEHGIGKVYVVDTPSSYTKSDPKVYNSLPDYGIF